MSNDGDAATAEARPISRGSLREIERQRDAGQAALKDLSTELKALNAEEERFRRDLHRRRQEVERKKVQAAGRVRPAQEALDRLAAKIPPEVERAISERLAEVGRLDHELRSHERDLRGRQFDHVKMRENGAKRDQLVEIHGHITQLEKLVAELREDLVEEKKGLEAAQMLRREMLEGLEADAAEELARLNAENTLVQQKAEKMAKAAEKAAASGEA